MWWEKKPQNKSKKVLTYITYNFGSRLSANVGMKNLNFSSLFFSRWLIGIYQHSDNGYQHQSLVYQSSAPAVEHCAHVTVQILTSNRLFVTMSNKTADRWPYKSLSGPWPPSITSRMKAAGQLSAEFLQVEETLTHQLGYIFFLSASWLITAFWNQAGQPSTLM